MTTKRQMSAKEAAAWQAARSAAERGGLRYSEDALEQVRMGFRMGWAARNPPPSTNPAIRGALRMVLEGATRREACEAWGLYPATLRRALRAAGVGPAKPDHARRRIRGRARGDVPPKGLEKPTT